MNENTTAASGSRPHILTLDALLETFTKIKRVPVLYYVDDRHCPKVDELGEPLFFLLSASGYFPAVIIFHPDYWDWFQETMRACGRIVRHFREWHPNLRMMPFDLQLMEMKW